MNTLLRLVASLSILLTRPAIAETVTYTVDSSASFVTLSGTFQGISFSEQTPGSSTAHYAGSFFGSLGNGLLALDGNNTVSLFQAVPQLPIPTSENGGLGAYGFRLETPMSGEVLIGIPNISFYLNTSLYPPLDITDGLFAPADVGFFLNGGTLLLSTAADPLTHLDLHGYGGPNLTALPGTFTTSGDVETVSIPILATFSHTALAPDDLSLTFSGQIVASRVVPEPTAALLLLCGCGPLVWRFRARGAR